MNSNYIKAFNKLKFMMIDIEKLINNDKIKSFEDKQICLLFESVLEDMKFVTHKIEYYSKTPISGVLCELPNGHFGIQGHELTCGSPLEVFSKEYSKWFPGRVEYDDKYYFYCSDLDNPTLYTGMEARIRL
jgi:hypothetical protein